MEFPKLIFYAARKSHPACTYCDSAAKKQSEVLICRKCALDIENWMMDGNEKCFWKPTNSGVMNHQF